MAMTLEWLGSPCVPRCSSGCCNAIEPNHCHVDVEVVYTPAGSVSDGFGVCYEASVVSVGVGSFVADSLDDERVKSYAWYSAGGFVCGSVYEWPPWPEPLECFGVSGCPSEVTGVCRNTSSPYHCNYGSDPGCASVGTEALLVDVVEPVAYAEVSGH